MRNDIRIFMVVLVFLPSMAISTGLARALASSPRGESGPGGDRTLSPYFFVKSDDPHTDRLPLKSTHADIKIVGVVADVTITQVYKNEGRKTLEAIYVFPASTRAAVYAMRMTVGERVIDAQIMERLKARQTYEQAKQAGQTSSLLEQQRPNVFQMNVANILPGDEIHVELKYMELIVPEDSTYEFVYPAVVAPRYSTTPAAGAPDTERWVENPYLHAGQPVPYEFGLSLDLRTCIPIARLNSPSHDIDMEYSGKTQAHLEIKNDPRAGTKDFVLKYKLAAGRIQAGLMLYPGREENFFLLMMEPPERVPPDAVLPREYIFIVDVSGSMHGFPINVAKALMEDIIGGLRPDDLMNVLLFAGGSAVLSAGQSLPATAANKQRAILWIKSQHGGGGTNILPALRRAFSLPRTAGVSRIVVVVTDGYVSVEPEAFELIRNRLGEANLFAFGIGSSVNRHLIEGMARVGRGEPFVVLNQSEARKQANKLSRYIQSPVLSDIQVTFTGLKVHDVEPIVVPALFALRPLVIFGKYDGEPEGEVIIRGRTASGPFRRVIPIRGEMASSDNSALRLLWARHRIMRLSDLNLLREEDQRIKEVRELGLKYSLMTQYTSFVAVDKVKRADGKIVTVKQPLPLPQGVSDLAVGGRGRVVVKSMARMQFASGVASEHVLKEFATVQSKVALSEDKEEETQKVALSVSVDEVRGDLDRAVLEKVLRRQIDHLASRCPCGTDKSTSVQGEVVFRILIEKDGTVKRVDLVTCTLKDTSIVECLKKAIQAITCPSFKQGTAEAIIKIECGSSK